MAGETAQKIRTFIVETFLFGEGGDDIADDESLLERGIIDSTGVLELTAYIEEAFGLQVGGEELVPENFDSIGKLAAFVERKRGK